MSNDKLRAAGELTREAALEMVRRMREELGRPISRKEFLERTGLSSYWLDHTFAGAWAEVRELAGLEPVPSNLRYSDDELLAGFHRAATAVGCPPRWKDLKRLTGIAASTFNHRWQRIPMIVQRYREWLEQHHPDSPLLESIDAAPPAGRGPRRSTPGPCAPAARAPRGRSRSSAPFRCPAGSRSGGAAALGEPIDCRHMRHAPINEQGVVLLFGILAPDLGFLVEGVQSGFPDCEAKRAIDKDGRAWQHVRIEFDYKSRNFRDHGHDPGGCDLLVCWSHDWPECPVEVLELRGIVGGGAYEDER